MSQIEGITVRDDDHPLRRALKALAAIAEGDNLEAVFARNTLEEIKSLEKPRPKLVTWERPSWDHAGPDY